MRLPESILIFFCLLLAGCSKGPEDLSHTHPRFQQYLRHTDGQQWKAYTNGGEAVIWTRNPADNPGIWIEARHARSSVDAVFPQAQEREIILYSFTNRAEFAAVVAGGMHALPRGASDGKHVFLYRSVEQDHGETLAHEWTHARTREFYPGLPLWLDEGYAMLLAERASVRLAERRNQRFRPALEILNEKTNLLPDERFYQLSGRLVQNLYNSRTAPDWRRLLEQAASGDALQDEISEATENWSQVDRKAVQSDWFHGF